MKFFRPRHLLLAACGVFIAAVTARASFHDDFDRLITRDADGAKDWNFFTGDGAATMTFDAKEGVARVAVDATTDRRGIWWAIIKRDISAQIDLGKLAQPGTELRVEARVRTSHAPRRLNLSFNTQRTKDFHGNLMEYDIPEAGEWQTISFTTTDFDGQPGDRLNAQLALMDWGLGRYQVEVDYFKVEVVDPAAAGPDLGVAVPYHPAIADPLRFRHVLPATASATVDRRESEANLADWSAREAAGSTRILSVNGTQSVILRWDLSSFTGRKAVGSGLLELKTHSVHRRAGRIQDFGIIRVVEILGGDPGWDDQTVTYASLGQGRPDEEVFNPQMIIDLEVNDTRQGSTLVTLPQPVLQRLLAGRTKGIALLPLGSINAAFFPATDAENAPKLRFNLEP